jgi:hypothetical protein
VSLDGNILEPRKIEEPFASDGQGGIHDCGSCQVIRQTRDALQVDRAEALAGAANENLLEIHQVSPNDIPHVQQVARVQ